MFTREEKGLKTKKVLFISHDASLSGAPFVLLYLLQWLQQNSNYQINVLLLEGGPIKNDFKKVCGNLFLVSEIIKTHSFANRVLAKLYQMTKRQKEIERVGRRIKVDSYDVIYGNTVVSLEWLTGFKKLSNSKMVCAIHELKNSLESFYDIEYLRQQLPKLDLIIAGSFAVANNLKERYFISGKDMVVVHAFIHTHIKPNDNQNVLESISVPDNRFIIGGVGSANWRKGTDLLVPVGLYLKKHHPNFDFHIVWVGGNRKEKFFQTLLIDVDSAGLKERITVIENSTTYLDYMNRFDLFLMLSREDPFPLVSLEAAYLGKPIIMFKGTGGTAELIENGGGEIVPYLDSEAMAEAIVRLAGDKEARKRMGDILRNEVNEKFSSDVACKKVFSILEGLS